jgi:hypothetical protein
MNDREKFNVWFATTNQVLSMKDWSWRCYQAATAESAARIAELEQKINALKVKAHESEMMAECTVMLRDDLIQAGIINETVPPMFMTEAILGHIRAITNTGDKT